MAKPIAPEQEALIVEALRSGKSTGREIAKRFGISPSGVSNIVKRNSLEKPKTGRPPSCELDHGAFDTITPESAYWIGFLFADGCIGDYGNGAPQLIVELAEKDRGHVEKFRAFLKSTHTIATVTRKGGDKIRDMTLPARTSAAYRVRSERLVRALISRGLATKCPDRIPNNEIENSVDFWRGCVDGDGTVRMTVDNHTAKDGHKNSYASIILCGHMPLLEKYQAFLMRHGVLANITDTDSGIFQIRLLGSGALTVIRLLYESTGVALDRKSAIAREIIRTHNP